MAVLTAVVVAGVGLAACGGSDSSGGGDPPGPGPTAATGGAEDRAVSVGGEARRYRLVVPTSSETEAMAAVLVLGGVGNTPADTAGATFFDRQAQTSGFAVAYPEGVDHTWNAGFCCAGAFLDGVDDVAFLRRVVQDLGMDPRIDPDRVFVVGFSAGAMMAYRFACEAADVVRGVGSVAGTMVLEDCNPSRPVAAMEVHGTLDQLVPFEGGPIQPPEAEASRPAPATAELARRWVEINGCEPEPTVVEEPPVATSTWSGCDAGSLVQLVVVEGGTHTWFGPGLGPANGAVDVTAELWRFFDSLGA